MPTPLAIGRFNHATLNCRDVGRSVAFYRDLLGLRQMKRPAFSFAGAWLYRDGLGMMIHLNEIQDLPSLPDDIQTRHRHLAFRAEDFDATLADLRERGIPFVERTLPDLGYRQAFFHDPDGNIIELGEWPDVEDLIQRENLELDG